MKAFLIVLAAALILAFAWLVYWTLTNLFAQTEVVGAIKWAALLIFIGLGSGSVSRKKE